MRIYKESSIKKKRREKKEGKIHELPDEPLFSARFHYACSTWTRVALGSYPCTSGSTGIKTSIVDIVSCRCRRHQPRLRKGFNKRKNVHAPPGGGQG